ncbi:hypothetical protein [Phytomonospora endophytica]|uniref:Uncharacterized protein n=1 Tax=Phytomonospora endophytica TaxID=714109 RepID=A0A841G242_9ACTN|nr:hypothetical protein [Phytomonospora endophytica]MBB6039988.1 hypothetical protein [Phytomonospora endophytica]
MVITAVPDRPELAQPRTWVVELATGDITVLDDSAAIGYHQGTVTGTADAPRLQLWSTPG